VARQIQIRALERSDHREFFDSGEPLLDVFLQQYAGQDQWRHHIAVTYVAVEDMTRIVCGFVTVAGATLDSSEALEVGAPTAGYSNVPALRVARLAVDRHFQGLGLGEQLLRYAMQLALVQSRLAGCVGVVVDTKPSGRGFYERYGFRVLATTRGSLADRPRQEMLYLGLGKIKAAVGE